MTDRIHGFFKESEDEDHEGHFHKVIGLHEEPYLDWETLSRQIPRLPRGWFELSRLELQDRVEFTREYWFARLSKVVPADITFEERLFSFFDKLEDVAIFATQEVSEGPFEVHMVYALKDDSGFFHGYPPATADNLALFAKQFANFTLPPDYLAFLSIHDGFSKYCDTGLIKTRDMARYYSRFQQVNAQEVILSPEGQIVDPKSLIPFYESFALHCYQCFYADWYPTTEMGNIYYAEKIEDPALDFLSQNFLDDNFAFASFLGWLMCYLEDTGPF